MEEGQIKEETRVGSDDQGAGAQEIINGDEVEKMEVDKVEESGGTPKERDEDDALNPFLVFPHPVWRATVDKLRDDPEVVWNLTKAFPQLFPHVVKKEEALFWKVLPFLLPELAKNDVLACRQVCRLWRSAVDNFLEEHPSTKPYDLESGFSTETGYRYTDLTDKHLHLMVDYFLEQLPEILATVQAYKDSGALLPRIVGKSVYFGVGEDKYERMRFVSMGSFYRKLKPFWETFGNQIQSAVFPITGPIVHTGPDCISFYEAFVRCLKKAEDLEILAVLVRFGIVLFPNSDEIAEQVWQQLEHLLETDPLPELPKLWALEIPLFGHRKLEQIPLARVLTKLLATYCAQLTKLLISVNIWNTESGISLFKLIHLELLNIERSSLDKTMDLLSKVDLSLLKKTELHGFRMELSHIFEMLQGFGLKPEMMVLSGNVDLFPNGDQEGIPSFPSVRALKIWMQKSDNPEVVSAFPRMMPLLQLFPNLEHLEMRLHRATLEDYERDKTGSKLLMGVVPENEEEETEDRETLIWNFLPKLKILVVGPKRMARELCVRECHDLLFKYCNYLTQ